MSEGDGFAAVSNFPLLSSASISLHRLPVRTQILKVSTRTRVPERTSNQKDMALVGRVEIYWKRVEHFNRIFT